MFEGSLVREGHGARTLPRLPPTWSSGPAGHAADPSLSWAENWPGGLRWIVPRAKPSRRQARNLTEYEKKTGWRYSVICTNIRR
jgi:hypothetical protein